MKFRKLLMIEAIKRGLDDTLTSGTTEKHERMVGDTKENMKR